MAAKARLTDLFDQFADDVRDLESARKTARRLVRDGNIDAAGVEVENAVRQWLEKRIPQRYGLAKGQIVDSTMTITPEFDIVIFDNLFSSVIFRSHDGRQYIPAESVYAVGEIKTSYSLYDAAKKNNCHIEEFAEKTSILKTQLQREAIPGTRIPIDDLIYGSRLAITPRNPIFSFVFYLDYGTDAANFKWTALRDRITQIESKCPLQVNMMPSMICIMPVGLVTRACWSTVGGITRYSGFNVVREWEDRRRKMDQTYQWAMYAAQVKGTAHKAETAIIAHFYMLLISTLRECRTIIPNWYKYIGKHLQSRIDW